MDYDSLDIREHDEEEKYFDDEDEESIHSESETTPEESRIPDAKDYMDDCQTFDPDTRLGSSTDTAQTSAEENTADQNMTVDESIENAVS